MVSGDELLAIARAMKEAQDSAQRLLPFTSERAAFDVPTAYAAAKLLHEARVREGARPVGRKIGFTNYNMWTRYGVKQPVWAYLYDRTVRTVGSDCICRVGQFVEPKPRRPANFLHPWAGQTPPHPDAGQSAPVGAELESDGGTLR
jgi:2-oxo-3-hexenedioate decarboxylase